jgi:hypothetical protein
VQEPKRTEKVAEIVRANVGMTLKAVEAIEIDDFCIDQKIAS